jgi:hypothetical protein
MMPRETVFIPFNSRPPWEAAAMYFAHIAFPDLADERNRATFCMALSRWAIIERAKRDAAWAQTPHTIHPKIFSQTERQCVRAVTLVVIRFSSGCFVSLTWYYLI